MLIDNADKNRSFVLGIAANGGDAGGGMLKLPYDVPRYLVGIAGDYGKLAGGFGALEYGAAHEA